jgi:3-oxoacyl-[acyl-carrier protein] reductase
MNIDFAGQTALVTGAGVGIGRRIAHDLAARGARTIATDINEAGLCETAATASPGCGGTLETRVLDVTRPESVRAIVQDIGGPVDILVHSAGGVCNQVGVPLEQVSLEDWQAIQAVNVTGAFLMAREVAPGMKAAGRGRIIVISSRAGLGVSMTGIQSYAATKAGEIGLTRQLAHELGQFGITVNSVAPGFIRSNPASERQWQAYGEDGQKRIVEDIAMRRIGKPEDISSAVLFLASEHASWITGQTLSVDGGI